MWRELGEELWSGEEPGRLHGIAIPERTCVMRLEGGDLLVYAPLALSDELRRELGAHGPVRHLLVPNLYRHPDLEPWARAFPGATVLGPRELQQSHERGWEADVDHHVFGGMPALQEVVLLHRRSRTLLLADLACHVPDAASLGVRLLLRLSFGGLELGPTRDVRWLVTDRRAAFRSLEVVLGWDFDRVVVRRGAVLQHGGKRALRRAYEWLEHEPAWWQ